MVSVVCLRCSKAHCCLEASTNRRLLMQAFCCEVVRAFTKLGIAMAASKPMMATTIMISTSVNPCFLAVLLFIVCLSYSIRRGCTKEQVIIKTYIHLLLFESRVSSQSTVRASHSALVCRSAIFANLQ